MITYLGNVHEGSNEAAGVLCVFYGCGFDLAIRRAGASNRASGRLDTASASATAHLVAEFHRGLGDAGYIKGQNVAIEYRFAEGDHNKLPGLVTDLVQRQLAVIAAIDTPSVVAAKAATQSIPIIFRTG